MAPQGFMTSSGHRLVLYIQEVSRRAQHLHEGQASSYDGTDYKKRKPGHQGSGFFTDNTIISIILSLIRFII